MAPASLKICSSHRRSSTGDAFLGVCSHVAFVSNHMQNEAFERNGEDDAKKGQEAIEYVDHELLTNRYHVTHYGGCAVLFNKDTFFPDV